MIRNKIRLPITLEWNEARKQWDAMFLGADQTDTQTGGEGSSVTTGWGYSQ